MLEGCTFYTSESINATANMTEEWTVSGSGIIIAFTNLQTYAVTAGGGAGNQECYVNILTNGEIQQLAYINNVIPSTWEWSGAQAVGFAKVTNCQVVQCKSINGRANATQIKRINSVLAFGCTLTKTL